MTVATLKKPIPVADRPDLAAAADYLEQLAAQLTGDYPLLDVGRQWRADRAAAATRHARALRRIGCPARSQHVNLLADRPCRSCGAVRAEDEVQP